MMKTRTRFFICLAVLAGLVTTRPASAVDTVEPWAIGATDLDFYVGFDGAGLGRHERTLSGELMLGYGIIERFSAYLGATLSADEYLDNGAGELYLGLFGTPLDTDHVDLDLFLDFRLGGTVFTDFELGPALELNFDVAADLELFGFYVVVGVPIARHTTTDESGIEREQTAAHIETTLGAYVTIGERHQLLIDFEMAFRPWPSDGERRVEVGSVGVGYNVTVHESIELINEFRLDIPQSDEPLSVGFVVGFIATFPTTRSTAQM